MSRKVCVVTGTRADYGLLRWVMDGVRRSPDLELQLIVTGTHLSPEFGLTYKAIESDGFSASRDVEILLSSDTPSGVAKSMGLGLIGFADAYTQLSPDIVFLVGDRYETLAAATSALVLCIPVAHAHGGEVSEGAIDESIRHAITKMSHLHFVAAETYRQRVIQLGENPAHVHLVGGLGLDNIKRLPLLDRAGLESSLDFKLGTRNLLITFHPETLNPRGSYEGAIELLAALNNLKNTHLIFTLPNADSGGREIAKLVDDFIKSHPNSRSYPSLGQLTYLSCLRHVDAVVGNSSSGLIEAPAFKIGTVNIGSRQQGRLRADSVIDCPAKRDGILDAIEHIYTAEHNSKVRNVVNPYGDAGAADRIIEILSSQSIENLRSKRFYDISFDRIAFN